MKKQAQTMLAVFALLLTISCNVFGSSGPPPAAPETAAEKDAPTDFAPPSNSPVSLTATTLPPTATAVPPTATPAPPTNTPEPEAISADESAIDIDAFSFRVAEVAYDGTALGLAPSGMGAGDQIVWVEFELLSGDQAAFEGLKPKLGNGANQSTAPIILASKGSMQMLATVTMTGKKAQHTPDPQNIAWAYVFPKSAGELYLAFPSGEKVDLTPVLP